ncbi:hypothetical protein AB0D27_28695 [Streptomyces sp. NPDC048415]|uniref:hypothetical protein n=1 Tax=Streptomyces sp. NPDC048415 TaxID=3154822 RepID=UPI003442D51E
MPPPPSAAWRDAKDFDLPKSTSLSHKIGRHTTTPKPWAWFCLIAVLLAFFAVLVLPAVAAIGIAASVVSDREGDLD